MDNMNDGYLDPNLQQEFIDTLGETFESELKSKSKVEYEGGRATISDVHLTTLLGNRVNVLETGRRYRYGYTVTFQTAAEGVGFGMAIKTVSGFNLTTASTVNGATLDHVKAGEIRRVEWEFTCNLQSGVYFFNAGVSAILEDLGRTHLHRILDALAFRVQRYRAETLEDGVVFADVQQYFLQK